MGSYDSAQSLLEALEGVCNIDVDSVDPDVARAMPFKPHNQTSNQVICCDTMLASKNRDMFARNVQEYGSHGWEEVFNRVSVEFCANNIENIRGRVLVQISPRKVYDREAVLEQAYAYDRAFRDVGISRDRYAIKISITGPAMSAAAQLNKEGIRVLGTSLFGLAQAIAASQAGCIFVSPYFNEVAAYSDSSLMHKGADPAMTHPMAPRMIHILETYTKLYQRTGQEQPLMVMASNANIEEVVANAELGVQHITVLAAHLKELAETPLDEAALKRFPFLVSPPIKKTAPYYSKLVTNPRFASHSTTDPLAGPNWNGQFASMDVDYLADNGAALDEAIRNDAAMTRKLKDVLDCFKEADAKAKAAIESELAKIKTQ